MLNYDVIVIGGGPAGLAAAISANEEGAKVLLIEREARLGGILKQCIHDGFGLLRFREKLSGPEYARRFVDEFYERKIDCNVLTYVTKIEKLERNYMVCVVNTDGVIQYTSKSIVLATGCRERTSKQVFIHGTRPSGVMSAGTAQYYTNLLGQFVAKRCVILGSGDIGLIMARRLTLEGAKVCGVYEAKSTPSGLTRNIMQCLNDFDIPLYLSHTVTRVFGEERLNAVEIMKVDESMVPMPGTKEIVACDALILSVGLIPENEIAESLNVGIDPRTKGPICDNEFMTSEPGIFICGNALHVNDLVDYVSESGELAGKAAANYSYESKELVSIKVGKEFLYFIPQRISISQKNKHVTYYFRSSQVLKKAVVTIKVNGKQIYEKKYAFLKPPEMESFRLDMSQYHIVKEDIITVELTGEICEEKSLSQSYAGWESRSREPIVKELVCIVCPKGCKMMIEENRDSIKVFGHGCKRGEEFALSEMKHPMRTISSTVKTNYPKVPVLPVRVSEEIPKDKIFDVMEEINKVVVTNPVSLGDIIIENVLGLKVNIIATSNILREQ